MKKTKTHLTNNPCRYNDNVGVIMCNYFFWW